MGAPYLASGRMQPTNSAFPETRSAVVSAAAPPEPPARDALWTHVRSHVNGAAISGDSEGSRVDRTQRLPTSSDERGLRRWRNHLARRAQALTFLAQNGGAQRHLASLATATGACRGGRHAGVLSVVNAYRRRRRWGC